jgi:hypothetical protein
MYSCACSLSSNPIDLCTVITCECSQEYGRTALQWASYGGHADTVRVLVDHESCVCMCICMYTHIHTHT